MYLNRHIPAAMLIYGKIDVLDADPLTTMLISVEHKKKVSINALPFSSRFHCMTSDFGVRLYDKMVLKVRELDTINFCRPGNNDDLIATLVKRLKPLC